MRVVADTRGVNVHCANHKRCMSWLGAAACAVLALGFPTNAAAESDWSMSYTAGFSWLDASSELTHSGPFTGELGSGPAAAMRVRYRFFPMLAMEVSALYGLTETKTDTMNPESLDVRVFAPRLDAVFFPKRLGRWTPYVLAGVGGLIAERDPRPNEFRSGAKDATIAGNLGAGLEFDLSRRLALRLDGLLTIAGRGSGSATYNGAVLGGVTVRFGRSYRDRDGDGFDDSADGDPLRAEDRDGFRDHDGIPDLDNDEDKIPDKRDKCPLNPETVNDYEDEDGCPDEPPDADRDGISDRDDKCADKPEDGDSYEDDDGCPDPDNDVDGIPDTIDQCPNQPETKNNYKDDDGCPDQVPDTDGDGILDNIDRCPKEPETKNGHADDDGCPDTKPAPAPAAEAPKKVAPKKKRKRRIRRRGRARPPARRAPARKKAARP